jgi:hypothetical protein
MVPRICVNSRLSRCGWSCGVSYSSHDASISHYRRSWRLVPLLRRATNMVLISARFRALFTLKLNCCTGSWQLNCIHSKIGMSYATTCCVKCLRICRRPTQVWPEGLVMRHRVCLPSETGAMLWIPRAVTHIDLLGGMVFHGQRNIEGAACVCNSALRRGRSQTGAANTSFC